MGGSVVDSLMENLRQLMNSKIGLIHGEKSQIEYLHEEFRLLRNFLSDWEDKLYQPKIVTNLATRIRDAACEAEDTVDLFVVDAILKDIAFREEDFDMEEKMGMVCEPILNLFSVKEQIEVINRELMGIYENKSYEMEASIQEGTSSSGSFSRPNTLAVERETVVGFEDEAMQINEQLNSERKQMDVISIIGMPGLGKTTLAKKVYNDPFNIYHFHVRAWVNVSQGYRKRDLLLRLLRLVGHQTKDIEGMSDEKLCDVLRKRLKGKRYLIVMDDIWETKVWDDLKYSFPNDNNGSRIMLTSRYTHVALYVKPDSSPLFLRFLTEDESWDLLQSKIFRGDTCPPELMSVGKAIAYLCRGLPLTVVVVGGILANIDKRLDHWERFLEIGNTGVSESNVLALASPFCWQTLALSYNHLPHHLKPCFLYFAAFPEDAEIPLWKLTWLWVAEGFIRKFGEKRLEDVAEEYLIDLIRRNLIVVSKIRSDGGIKSCSIHDLLREFCRKKAEEEHFLQEILRDEHDPSFSSSSGNLSCMRRLCINSKPDIVIDFSEISAGLNTRSILCMVTEYVPFKNMQLLFRCFKLLRVLDMSLVDLTAYPREIEQLVLLRYLAFGDLWGDLESDDYVCYFPPSISNLWNLESLIIIRRSVSYVILPDSIWKMVNLRHLCVGGKGTFLIENRNPEASLDNLQTLSAVDQWSCWDFLVGAPNLRKLSLRGDMVFSRILSIPDLSFLNHLQKLKLYNTSAARCCDLSTNLEQIKFPPNLRRLTLKRTFIIWEEISILGKLLPNLEVLKLSRGAGRGAVWETSWEFPRLKFLKLKVASCKKWKVSSNHFPSLQRLVLDGCFLLKKIPSEIGDITTLQKIEVKWCHPSLVDSAWQIQKEQRREANDQLQIIDPCSPFPVDRYLNSKAAACLCFLCVWCLANG